MTITAAADGSALGNPGPAGWAWYVDENCWRAGGWPHGTNNQGELMAVLDLFRATEHLPDEKLHILCDSQYVINSVTKWMPGWKRKGWRKADGKPVLNVELLQDIDRALTGRKYTFEWVKGHAGHNLNEAADERARAAATAYQQGIEPRRGPGFAMSGSAAASTAPPAAPARQAVPDSEYYADDLFSELEREAASGLQQVADNPEAEVERLERELLVPEVRADIGRTGVLLHPDYQEIGASGRMWSRDAILLELEEDPGEKLRMDVLGADRVGTSAILLTYRSYSRTGSVLRSSLWVLDGEQWRLRFHQGTPEL
ncbi:ribonuclease HI family protein [Pseudarthrobacter sp. J75]|uniref:ribonuclease HI family protein n=1 Tax=unclassified Pseudarthrobacter TaxID=2647000 RepID=UPI002E81C1C6|nr:MULTISPECIES: ribonuclease HI family protein [unclassified Pseudarthrobacter]MEE2523194.1 ribonuclease HI family protein [Pseudarthrobacter sp. J47]MEE2527449.1 ribonuclease HI family protein [Pseudarthrobacter sp. J75]